MKKCPPTRIDFIDGFKAIAMLIIVLHHFASYGPLADAAQAIVPNAIEWFSAQGRLAVQVFLVIGGYLAARTLSPEGRRFSGDILAVVANRYLRLAIPYAVALLFAIASAAYARHWIDDEAFISSAPAIGQLLAHLLFLQDILHYESLTTGVWYIAIDFQLFALLAILLWLSRSGGSKAHVLALTSLFVVSGASLYWFNRDDSFDSWALYFFGSYGLGAATYWARSGSRDAVVCQRLLWLAAAVALVVDFRWRLLFALATALMLDTADVRWLLLRGSWLRGAVKLGRVSYSLFLVHFPVYMLISAVYVQHEMPGGAWSGVLGMALTLALSTAGAFLLHRWVERPIGRLRFFPSSAKAAG